MTNLSTHARGFLMTLIGVLVLTPDTLLFRLIDTDAWTITFWRGILMPLGTLLIFIAYYRRDVISVIFGIGRIGLVIAAVSLVGNISFNVAVTHTTVAKALIMLACAPVFAALLSVVFLREHIHRATWLVIAAAFIGICVVVSDHLGVGSGSLLGDAAGLMAAFTMAGTFVLMRYAKAANMVPALALGWVIGAFLVLPFASPMSLSGSQITYMAIMGLLVLPISFTLINLGPRYIPAPEVSLLMLLETVIGPLWVWIVVKEEPSLTTLIGGAIVVTSIALYSAWRLWGSKQVPYSAEAK